MEGQNFTMFKQVNASDDVPVTVIDLAQETIPRIYYKTDVTDDDLASPQKVVGQQFNPFHPMAAHFITDMKQDKYRVTGFYQMRNRRRKFSYNLRQMVYRIHSDRWLVNLGVKQNSIMPEHIVFDIVSNFDIRRYFDTNKVYGVLYELPPIVVMPLKDRYTARDRQMNKAKWKEKRASFESWGYDSFYSSVTNLIQSGKQVEEHEVGEEGSYVLPYSSDRHTQKESKFAVKRIPGEDICWEGDRLRIRGHQISLNNQGYPKVHSLYRKGDSWYEKTTVGIECRESLVYYSNAPRNAFVSLVQDMMTLSLADYVRMIHIQTRLEYPFLYAYRHYFFQEPLLEADTTEFTANDYPIEWED
jgi:hypothetical protein